MTKKIAIMQPYLFPYLGYWQLINYVDDFIIFDDVNYIKKGWINRNNILLNKQKYLITLPVQKASQNKLIKDLFFIDQNEIINKIFQTIALAYKKAPYYKEIIALIEEILFFENKNIPYFIFNQLKIINKFLKVNTNLEFSSRIIKNEDLKGQDKIIDICIKKQATIYINPIGGIELYKRDDFKKNNIDLFFLKMGDIKYKQFNNNFINNLSIIDLLMFNSKNEVLRLLDDFVLV